MALPLLALALVLSFFLITFPSPNTAQAHYSQLKAGPMLVHDPLTRKIPKDSSDFDIRYYPQTLDHFNYNPHSYTKFNQKYMLYTKYWGKGMAPIFVFLGAEAPMTPDLTLLTDAAPHFRALVLYIEHRFYGDSIPFGMSMEEVITNASVRGYFNSAQALADYAEIILKVKTERKALHSPVVVFGGSYGGMLATWFRLKYPHVAMGALASSAPILYFDNITPHNAYYELVSKDFGEASKSCYKRIRESWSAMDTLASKPKGLSALTKKFNLCAELNGVWELKSYLIGIYAVAAQYGRPPIYKATSICNAIEGAKNTNVVNRIFKGLEAYYGGTHKGCYNLTENSASQTNLGWGWQTCSDLAMPIGIGSKNTMFEAQPFEWSSYIAGCKSRYSVVPRSHWITTYYGGNDIKLILERFGSNIIFSNGLKDPYSSAGVVENISESLIAINTNEGSHCMDILQANSTSDPEWLVAQRNKEMKVIRGWIKSYYADLTKSSEA